MYLESTLGKWTTLITGTYCPAKLTYLVSYRQMRNPVSYNMIYSASKMTPKVDLWPSVHIYVYMDMNVQAHTKDLVS